MLVEMKLYVLKVPEQRQRSVPASDELHAFIMEALTEGRIDFRTANRFLAECRVHAMAVET